jgi:hypothetical protein
MFSFLKNAVFGAIASGLAILFLIGFIWQTVRIDGFLWFSDGLVKQLTDAKDVIPRANAAALEALEKGRAEGRASAALDDARIQQERDETLKSKDQTIATLRAAIVGLRPSTITTPPATVTVIPAAPPAMVVDNRCRFDPAALERIRTALNAQRGY